MAGIYIHIPFCRKRCSYCDFFFIINTKLKREFLSALKKEISLHSDNYRGEIFDTVFFGGGTPSILTADEISGILTSLKENFRIERSSEISVEANPEDFSRKKTEEYINAGVNRFSFGVQSFIDAELKFLTRQHTSDSAQEVIKFTSSLIKNVSADIIYSLPSQTSEDISYSIDRAVECGVSHISAYSLTYEKGTSLYKSFEKEPAMKNDPSLEAELYLSVSEKIISEGFDHYEVSNFAKKGFESRHNLKYWTYENYLGLGPSSHSFFHKKRWNNPLSFSSYVNSLVNNILPAENIYEPDKNQSELEYIMLGLRSIGIEFGKYEKLFGADFLKKYERSVNDITSKEFAVLTKDNLRLSESGYCLADEIIARYF
ncbi:MAG: radical SAM family heme chaperone HemW [Bacteroidetes bacterium]|nr:radical SAM family heme chaperone HemW [Bacteroidota bacterium]